MLPPSVARMGQTARGWKDTHTPTSEAILALIRDCFSAHTQSSHQPLAHRNSDSALPVRWKYLPPHSPCNDAEAVKVACMLGFVYAGGGPVSSARSRTGAMQPGARRDYGRFGHGGSSSAEDRLGSVAFLHHTFIPLQAGWLAGWRLMSFDTFLPGGGLGRFLELWHLWLRACPFVACGPLLGRRLGGTGRVTRSRAGWLSPRGPGPGPTVNAPSCLARV